jgi:prepilin signal peptidase PulO-like enzyme (type II secretory pathway)
MGYMTILLGAAFFLFGTIVASFVGVVTARLSTGQSFVTGRSRCDACDAPLSSRSLVPVVSYMFSFGRAECCGAHISLMAPLTETLLGALFVIAYLTLGPSLVLVGMLVSLATLLALVLYDLSHQILPVRLLVFFIGVSALTGLMGAGSFSAFLATVPMALLTALFLLALHVFSRGRAMGFADAPLVFALALLTGPAALSGLVFSFWIGAVVGIVLLARRPAGSRMGVEVPFAPFLAAGFLLAYFTAWNPFTLIATLSQ